MGKEKRKQERKHISSSHRNPTFLIGFIILLALLSFTAFFRNTTWKHDLTLWDDVINKGANKPRAYNNLGVAYTKKGQYDMAIEDFNKELH